jgi:hypothetical protein
MSTRRKQKKGENRKRGLFGFSGPSSPNGKKALDAALVVIAAGAGAMAGAAVGKHSLYPGLAAAAAGSWIEQPLLIAAGSGMAFSHAPTATPSAQEGVAGIVEEAKNRVMAFGSQMMEKSYLDKVISTNNSAPVSGIEGLGEVNYFISDNAANYEVPQLDFSRYDQAVAQLTSDNAIQGVDAMDLKGVDAMDLQGVDAMDLKGTDAFELQGLEDFAGLSIL